MKCNTQPATIIVEVSDFPLQFLFPFEYILKHKLLDMEKKQQI